MQEPEPDRTCCAKRHAGKMPEKSLVSRDAWVLSQRLAAFVTFVVAFISSVYGRLCPDRHPRHALQQVMSTMLSEELTSSPLRMPTRLLLPLASATTRHGEAQLSALAMLKFLWV